LKEAAPFDGVQSTGVLSPLSIELLVTIPKGLLVARLSGSWVSE
jgi:hypothetical protein